MRLILPLRALIGYKLWPSELFLLLRALCPGMAGNPQAKYDFSGIWVSSTHPFVSIAMVMSSLHPLTCYAALFRHIKIVPFILAWTVLIGGVERPWIPWVQASQTQPATPASVELLTPEEIEALRKQVEESKELDDETKNKLQETYGKALAQIESVEKWAAKAGHFVKMADAAPQELPQAKSELNALPKTPRLSIPEGTIGELEQRLSEKRSLLEEKKALLAGLEAEPKHRANRRVEIPKLTAAARAALAELAKESPSSSSQKETSSPLVQARRMLTAARRRALEQEILAYEKELRAYESQTELLPVRRDLAARQVALLEQEVAHWRDVVNQRRQEETQVQLRRARWEAQQAQPAIGQLFENVTRLAERRKAVAELIVRASSELERTTKQLNALEDQFARTREKVDTVGLTNAIGLLLRKQREKLPDLSAYRHRVDARQETIRDIQFELLHQEDRRSDLSDVERQVQRELRSLAPVGDNRSPVLMETAVRDALESEKEYLDALILDLNSYFDKLVDLDNAERQLVKLAESYERYANERVLWIRNAPSFGLAEARQVGPGAAWLVQPKGWADVTGCLWKDFRANPSLFAASALFFGLVLYGRRRFRKHGDLLGETASRATCWRLLPTNEALAISVLMALIWPALAWYVTWRLHASHDGSGFPKAVADGIGATATVWLLMELLRQMWRDNGLFQDHFGWSASGLRLARHYLRLAAALVLPMVFIVAVTSSQENELAANSLGRLAFMTAMAVSSFLMFRALRPGGAVRQALLAPRQGGWLDRTRHLWYAAAWGAPLILAGLAMTGYYYTAQQLASRLLSTAYVLLVLVVVRGLVLRWVLVNRRKLAIRQAQQRRAENQQASLTTDEAAPALVPMVSNPSLDLATINTQTRQLVEHGFAFAGLFGLWMAWGDVLPALRILDHVELWQAGEAARVTTLADLGLASFVLIVVLLAARNLPGLLEMTVLQRLSLDAGLRYTIGTVSRYFLTIIGIVVAGHLIGLGWGKVQWLIAAISVGLGFGLQEIFANFVSGLIILFERPVRVGDVVTVDDVTGVISRIRMRATTITNWDRKEFIVPNKEFVTGRLLNWTLSDQVNRIVINVGVAYGSDTRQTTALLMKVAGEHALVLDEPKPLVTFEAFGDSSLNFVLRCYLPDLDKRLAVIHDLHMRIDEEFKKAGIEIAFPQQDIHIRSIDAHASLLDPASPENPRAYEQDERGSRQVA